MYGRFGYFVMSIACALIMLIFASGLQDIIYGKYTDGISGIILIILLGISGPYYLAHCLIRFLSPSFRFQISDQNIVYNGIFSKKIFAFKNINGFKINYTRRSPFVFLLIYSSERKRPFTLDVSGLRPNYNILIQCIKDRLDKFEQNRQ